MTPLEHIIGLMDPSYSLVVRRAMAQGILQKYADELAQEIMSHNDGSILDDIREQDANRVKAHAPAEG